MESKIFSNSIISYLIWYFVGIITVLLISTIVPLIPFFVTNIFFVYTSRFNPSLGTRASSCREKTRCIVYEIQERFYPLVFSFIRTRIFRSRFGPFAFDFRYHRSYHFSNRHHSAKVCSDGKYHSKKHSRVF